MSELNHPILIDKQLEQQLFTIDHKEILNFSKVTMLYALHSHLSCSPLKNDVKIIFGS
jgi:hypothetical protein